MDKNNCSCCSNSWASIAYNQSFFSNSDTKFNIEQQGNNNIAISGKNIKIAGGNIYADVYGDIIYQYRESEELGFEINTDKIKSVNEWIVGWGDTSGGRQTYTIEQINDGALGENIVFNSIVDTNDSLSPEDKAAGVIIPLTDERNFVGARENSGLNLGKDNVWNGNEIEIEEGKTYIVRLYVHNNNPLGYNAIAKDVSVQFLISDLIRVQQNDISLDGFDSGNGYYGVSVHGFLDSSNANPSSYWDGVKFVSNKPFELKYIPGSALLENNGIGASSKYGPYVLSDDIVTEKGIPLGYDILDGNMPGCYQYTAYISIVVMPVFYEQSTKAPAN